MTAPTPPDTRPRPASRGPIALAPLGAIAIALALVLAACSSTGASPIVPPSPSPGTSAGPSASTGPGTSPDLSSCPTSQPAPLPAGEVRDVSLETQLGTIVIKVEGALAPIAAGNFVALAECGYYTGTVFHRLVPDFVIQGGDGQYGRVPIDSAQVGYGGPGYTIQDEPVTTTYGRGTVAMARSSAPNSQGSQFFIVLDDQARAPLESANTYAIFGTVVDGMDVVDQIAAMPNSGPPANSAIDPVVIDAVTVTTP
jgi:cyclophilin family peptidyl-prolyl cis-trans isomerase